MEKKSANLLTFARVIAGWLGQRSAESAASAIGVAPNTLRNWIAGDSFPPATRIPSLATALGVPEKKLRQVIARERAARLTPVAKGA